MVTEDLDRVSSSSKHMKTLLPQAFSEIVRTKPKIPGLKESSFIQGSRAIMDTFKVTSLQPFQPRSQTVYSSPYKTGPSSDDSFMHGLAFDVHEPSA